MFSAMATSNTTPTFLNSYLNTYSSVWGHLYLDFKPWISSTERCYLLPNLCPTSWIPPLPLPTYQNRTWCNLSSSISREPLHRFSWSLCVLLALIHTVLTNQCASLLGDSLACYFAVFPLPQPICIHVETPISPSILDRFLSSLVCWIALANTFLTHILCQQSA